MWLLLAAFASMFWGITYVLNEQIFKQLSVPTTIAIEALFFSILTIAVMAFTGNLKTDLATVSASRSLIWLLIAGTVAALIAELLIGFSINAKNATLAGLIEISYPLFIALFSYLLFSENELNTGTALGGGLVFIGIAVIYWFSR
jgi:drug/metabolite transporter (DMT)-like permease